MLFGVNCMVGLSLRNRFTLNRLLIVYIIFAAPKPNKTMVGFVSVLDHQLSRSLSW